MIPDVGSDLKVDLRVGFSTLKDKMVGPRGLIKKTEKLVKESPPDALKGSNLDDGDGIIKIMTEFRERLNEKLEEVENCRKGDVGSLQSSYTAMMREYVVKVQQPAEEVASAMEFAIKQQKTTQKLLGMKNRYRITKFKEWLALGGFLVKFANRIAHALFVDESNEYTPDPKLVRDKFDCNKVRLSTDDPQLPSADGIFNLGARVRPPEDSQGVVCAQPKGATLVEQRRFRAWQESSQAL